MKTAISKNQQTIIDELVKEFSNINKKYEEPKGKKSSLDVSFIMDDVKAKQKAIDESASLKAFWKKTKIAQLDKDVIKLNKILKPIGFSCETITQRDIRTNYGHYQDYHCIIITHNTNKYQVNSSKYLETFDIKYEIDYDNSKRADVKTACGFYIVLHGRSVNTDAVKTIEEAFEFHTLKGWIKEQYERATLVTH